MLGKGEELRLKSDSPAMSINTEPLMQISELKVEFSLKGGQRLTAVDGVDLTIHPKEILGLVGESGCGKTVLSLSILRLVPRPGRIMQGQILFEERDLLRLDERTMRETRGKRIAMIFQNPQAALHPTWSIKSQMTAIMRLHRQMSNDQAYDEAIRLLQLVQIPDPERAINSFPHQFSMGMCQRLTIAMALSCRPQLLIADEPTASLDVTVQAQILDLLLRIRDELGMSILLVSHDLGVIAGTCDRVAVMYLGRIVEVASAKELYKHPLHPYTEALLNSIPLPNPDAPRREPSVMGDVPSPVDIPSGCRFRSRCPRAFEACARIDPLLKPPDLTSISDKGGRKVACLLYDEPSSQKEGFSLAQANTFLREGGNVKE